MRTSMCGERTDAIPGRRLPAGASRHLAGGGYRIIALALTAMILTGCNAKPVGQSTRWTIDDVEAMTHEMAQSLRDSEAFAKRGPDSEPWIISMDKVLNLSDEVMTPNEQWSIMAQVRGAADIQALWDEKAVRFVIPPERVVQLRNSEYGYDFDDSFAQNRKVTHTLTATFRSLTRAQAKQRSDLYYCEFEILDFATHEPVWTDKFEFKRSAKGHVWD